MTRNHRHRHRNRRRWPARVLALHQSRLWAVLHPDDQRRRYLGGRRLELWANPAGHDRGLGCRPMPRRGHVRSYWRRRLRDLLRRRTTSPPHPPAQPGSRRGPALMWTMAQRALCCSPRAPPSWPRNCSSAARCGPSRRTRTLSSRPLSPLLPRLPRPAPPRSCSPVLRRACSSASSATPPAAFWLRRSLTSHGRSSCCAISRHCSQSPGSPNSLVADPRNGVADEKPRVFRVPACTRRSARVSSRAVSR